MRRDTPWQIRKPPAIGSTPIAGSGKDMSKLIEKLHQTCEGPVQSIGFRTVATSSAPSMVLLVLLTQADADEQEALRSAQADAVLWCVDADNGKDLENLKQVAGELPWGLWADDYTHDQLRQLTDVGVDFLVFDAERLPAAVMQLEGVGKILRVDTKCEDTLLGTLSQMPVDGVLAEIESRDYPCVSVRDLMCCRSLADETCRPLMVIVDSEVSEDDLRALWEVGVGGIVVRGNGEVWGEGVERLREMIGALPAKRKGHQEGNQVLLPKSGKDRSSRGLQTF